MLERHEISVINLSQVKNSFLRFDSEYYSHENLKIQETVANISGRTIKSIGGILDCSAFYPSIAKCYSDNREWIPFLRVNEIANGLVVLTDRTAFLPQEVLDHNSKTITFAYPGDIIIAKGGNTLAKVGLVTDEYPQYATCRDVIILRTNFLKGINKYFLWAFLHSKYGQSMMWRAASQTGQPHLTLSVISNLHIPEFSSKLQDKCADLYKESVSCKLKAQELYAEANEILTKEFGFNGWEQAPEQISIRRFSVIKKAERIDAEYYQPMYDDLFARLDKLTTERLGEIVNITKSIEPGSKYYSDEGVPFVRVSDISIEGISTPSTRIPKSVVPNIETLYPQKDTILFSKDGSVGIAFKVEEDLEAVTSGALLHLQIKNTNKILPDYLTLVLNSEVVHLQAERDFSGAVIDHWNPNDIANVIVPILSSDVQLELSNKVQESFSLRHRADKLINTVVKAVEIAVEGDESAAINFITLNL